MTREKIMEVVVKYTLEVEVEFLNGEVSTFSRIEDVSRSNGFIQLHGKEGWTLLREEVIARVTATEW